MRSPSTNLRRLHSARQPPETRESPDTVADADRLMFRMAPAEACGCPHFTLDFHPSISTRECEEALESEHQNT